MRTSSSPISKPCALYWAQSQMACDIARIDIAGLANASRNRHRCEVIRRLCFFNGTMMPLEAGPDADAALQIATTMIVRSQFGSHARFPLAHLHPMRPPTIGTSAASLLRLESDQLSRCVPLVWVPVWAFSFADSFVSSLVPIDELQSAGLIDEHVQLRPDLVAWPRSKNPIYRMIGSLSAQPIRTVREVAPKCSDASARRWLEGRESRIRGDRESERRARRREQHCAPTCYERVLVCNFRSTFDPYGPPMSPWRAGQRVAAAVEKGRPVSAQTALAVPAPKAGAPTPAAVLRVPPVPETAVLRVVFVNRTRTKFSRSLANLWQLLQRCQHTPPSRWARGTRVECAAHEFGAGSLARDVRAARLADVLVGTHGAGLANAFFMRRGASLVEVRPYRFEGSWPDRYFRALTALEQAVLYWQVSSGSAELSVPRPPDDVSVWDARDHAVRLPWRTLREVLTQILEVRSSRAAYLRQLWASGVVYTSQPQPDRRQLRQLHQLRQLRQLPAAAWPAAQAPSGAWARHGRGAQRGRSVRGAGARYGAREPPYAQGAPSPTDKPPPVPLATATTPQTHAAALPSPTSSSAAAAASPPLPTVHVYDLPAALVRRHSSPTGQNVLADVLERALRHSPHRATRPERADLYFVPVPFHWGGRGRLDVAAVLGYARSRWRYFNTSLGAAHPNHLLLFTGDMGMDLPTPRAQPALPAELDASHGAARHFVALTLTGNPEVGFQRGKDLVLPPTHFLKGGPSVRERCCAPPGSQAVAGPPRARARPCKHVPTTLADSPWRQRPRGMGLAMADASTDPSAEASAAAAPAAADTARIANLSFLVTWAGQASGGGMGRHGGSGVRVRHWLSTAPPSELPRGALVTDTNNPRHLRRNVQRLPAWALGSSAPGHRQYGFLSPNAAIPSTFCLAPYGRGNGWEGRSASALRAGCIPLSIAPEGSVRALEPLVPWERFSLFVADAPLATLGERLRHALQRASDADVARMRCEMACAATHMSWGEEVPPASCAAAAQRAREVGVVPTLLRILANRRLPVASRRRRPTRRCPCESAPSEWHYNI